MHNEKTVIPEGYIPTASHLVVETPEEVTVTEAGVSIAPGTKWRTRKLRVYAVGENVSGYKVGDSIDLNLREIQGIGKVPSHVVEIKPYFSLSQIHLNYVAGKREGLTKSYDDTKAQLDKALEAAKKAETGNPLGKSNLIERI